MSFIHTGRDGYRSVLATLKAVRPNSIFIAIPSRPSDVSIPRSLIHGGDDLRLERAPVGEQIVFRMKLWKAEEVGLA